MIRRRTHAAAAALMTIVAAPADAQPGAQGVNNGTCANAREITMSPVGAVWDSLDQAVNVAGPCGWTAPKVWFTFVGNERTVTFDTCFDTNFDSRLEAFRGTCAGLTCITQNDNYCDTKSAIQFFADAGERYYVAVQSASGQSGPGFTFALTYSESAAPPAPTIASAPIVNPANGHTYFRTTSGIWRDQELLAQSIGGHLVTINNAAENTWVWSTFVSGGQGDVWIGLNDRANEGVYVWTSGETAGYRNWAPGQPDNAGDEDQVHIRSEGRWNDLNATAAQPAVIEVANDSCYDAQPLALPSSVTYGYVPGAVGPGEITCGSTVILGRGIWYKITGDGSMITATTCGGSTNFDTTLRVLTGDCANMICVEGNDDACESPSSAVSFYADAGRDYFIVVGSYQDESWGGTYTLSVSSSGPLAPPAFTARSEVNAEDCSRYFLLSDAWYLQASSTARANGLNLASVSSDEDNAFIQSFANSAGYPLVWIGFTDFGAPDGQFTWLDGSPVTYTGWAPNQPDGGVWVYFTYLYRSRWSDVDDSPFPSIAEAHINASVGGHIRGALAFSNDSARLPDNFWSWPRTAFSIECWFRTTSGGVLFGQDSLTTSGHVPVLYVGADGRLRAADWAGSLEASQITGPVVNNGAWHHVAFVRTGTLIELFVDGVLSGSKTNTPVGHDPGGAYRYVIGSGNTIGWPSRPAAEGFVGDIDEFRVWGVSRTLAQIVATRDTRYFNPANYGTDLIVSLDFDDAGGRLAFDSTGHGLHGRLQGDPIWLYENRNGDKTPDVCEPACPADIDGNAVVNSTDVSAFINLWFADQSNNTLNADFNRDGTSNSTDVSDMINAYFEASDLCTGP